MKDMHMHQETMKHMTFFWGKSTIFSGWHNQSFDLYVFSLMFVFVISVFIEWLSHTRLIKSDMNNVVAGLLQTVMYAIRVGLAYLVMLAVMSFNVGVLLVAVAGYTVGYLLFGSLVFKKPEIMLYRKSSDLPPLNC